MGLFPSILLFSSAGISLIVGLAVFIRDYKKLENIAFFALGCGIACWGAGIAGFNYTQDIDQSLAWAKFYYFAPLLIAYSAVIFAQRFVAKANLSNILNLSVALSGVVLALLLLVRDDFITKEIVQRDYGKQVILDTSQYMVYGIYLFACFSVTIYLINKKRLNLRSAVARQQASIFLMGFLISSSLGLAFNYILPGLNNYEYIIVGPVSTAALIFAIAYAIVKHRMFDVRLVIARSMAYLTSVLVVASIFGLLVFGLLSYVFDQKFELELQLVASFATAFVAIIFSKIKQYFDKISNSLFYRDAYDSQHFLDQLNRILVLSTDVDTLLKKSGDLIKDNIKSQICYFELRKTAYVAERYIGERNTQMLLGDKHIIENFLTTSQDRVIVADELQETHPDVYEVMRKYGVAIIARLVTTLRYDSAGLGYLVLGDKRSGNPYSKNDIDVIRIVATELVIAIQNALRFEEIENFSATLQNKVDDATRKLKRANEKLQQMDETKDEFISMASHQLRTPLTSVKGYVSMVLEGDAGPLNDMQKKLLEQSFISSQRMVYLIADLLNLSRLKTGKFVVEVTPTNLADVIEGEVAQLKETAAGKNMTLTYNRPDSFPTLMLDETKIRQVIMNFVDNAIYYTPAGGKIDISLKETASSVEFRVKDNGIGVPESEQHNLFNKFFRAKNAQKARPDGTGLGLFMAKKVIVAQKGALLFESKVGKGSTFGFSFAKAKLAVPEQIAE